MFKDRSIVFLAIAQTLVWAAFYYLFPALLLRWENTLGWSKAEITGAITLAIFVSALTAPLAGRFIDHGRGALMMTVSSFLGGICLLWLSQVESRLEFYLVWSVLGAVMAGCLYEPCFALITRARKARAKQAIILVSLVAGFASTLCYPAIHSLSEAWGWRPAVQVFAAIILVIATPLMWLGASAVEASGYSGNRKRAGAADGRRSFLYQSPFWLLALAFTALAVVHGVTIHHMFPILADRGLSADAAVTAASFIGPMQVAGRLAMMAAEKHLSFDRITASCFILVSLAVLLLIASSGTPTLVVGFVILFGSAHGIVSIVRPVVTREILGDDDFGAKFGAIALLYLVGSAASPYLGSLVWESGGYELVLPVLIGVAMLGLLLYLGAHRRSLKIK